MSSDYDRVTALLQKDSEGREEQRMDALFDKLLSVPHEKIAEAAEQKKAAKKIKAASVPRAGASRRR